MFTQGRQSRNPDTGESIFTAGASPQIACVIRKPRKFQLNCRPVIAARLHRLWIARASEARRLPDDKNRRPSNSNLTLTRREAARSAR